jgi:glycosyltransferase involved in cell wall biosynthesis
MSIYERENPKYFESALESILNQDLLPSEIVIVKDGPLTKNLDDVLTIYSQKYLALFHTISLPQNVGLGESLRVGVLNCKYDIVARMDSDDICHTERFKRQIEFLENNPHIDVVGSWIAEFEHSPNRVTSIRKVPTIHENIRDYAKFRNPINHMTVVFRKEAILKSGNYQVFSSFEDYYLWVRMLLSGIRFANIHETLVFVRIEDSMFNRRKGIEYLRKEIRFHKKMFTLGFITYREFLRNIAVRIPVRLVNTNFLKILYKKFARR